MSWYEFTSEESFNSWHQIIKNELGLPKMSIDQNGLPCDPIIENYTQLLFNDNRFIAFVDPEHSEGLVETKPPILELNFPKGDNAE